MVELEVTAEFIIKDFVPVGRREPDRAEITVVLSTQSVVLSYPEIPEWAKWWNKLRVPESVVLSTPLMLPEGVTLQLSGWHHDDEVDDEVDDEFSGLAVSSFFAQDKIIESEKTIRIKI